MSNHKCSWTLAQHKNIRDQREKAWNYQNSGFLLLLLSWYPKVFHALRAIQSNCCTIYTGLLPFLPGKAFIALKGCLQAIAFKQNSFKSKVLQLLSWLLNHCLRCSLPEVDSTGKSRNASVSHSSAPLWILSQKASLSGHNSIEMWSFPKEVSPWICSPSMQNFTSLSLSLPGGFFLPCSRSALFSFLL